MSTAPPLPAEVARLFWDVDPATVDLDRHRDYVLERVMARGGWIAMGWLRRAYAPEVLADFLRRKGSRMAPRELAYWAVIAGIELPIPPGRPVVLGWAVSADLSPEQERALDALARVVDPSSYYLAGGVAVALRIPLPLASLDDLESMLVSAIAL